MYKALLIGISYDKSKSNRISGCSNDVQCMKSFLMNHSNFKENNILILTDNSAYKPTRENICRSIEWLIKDSSENDRLFFHYSGHGENIYDEFRIMPIDYKKCGYIYGKELRSKLLRKLKRGVKLTMIFDCCHSGTNLNLKYTYTKNKRKKSKHGTFVLYSDEDYSSASAGSLKRNHKRYLNKTRPNIVVLTSCHEKQSSTAICVNGVYYGMLTYFFLLTMSNHNYRITYYQLLRELSRNFKQNGYEQIPQLLTGKRINLNDSFNIH